MSNKESANQFQEVHKQVQERLARANDARERDADVRSKKAAEEAVREGFDRA